MAPDIAFSNRPVREARRSLQRNAAFFEDKNWTGGAIPYDVAGASRRIRCRGSDSETV